MVSSASRRSRSRRSIACVYIVCSSACESREHTDIFIPTRLLLLLLPSSCTRCTMFPVQVCRCAQTDAAGRAGQLCLTGPLGRNIDGAPHFERTRLLHCRAWSRARGRQGMTWRSADRLQPGWGLKTGAQLLPQQTASLQLSAGETTLGSQVSVQPRDLIGVLCQQSLVVERRRYAWLMNWWPATSRWKTMVHSGGRGRARAHSTTK